MSAKKNQLKSEFLKLLVDTYGEGSIVTRSDIKNLCDEKGLKLPFWFFQNDDYKAGRNQYRVSTSFSDIEILDDFDDEEIEEIEEPEENIIHLQEEIIHVKKVRAPILETPHEAVIPKKNPDYQKFGFYEDLQTIIVSEMFFPVFISGLSGNGKTLMVEEICAQKAKKMIRVNISVETDQTDLLGGPTLVEGNVVNRDGPVITAMRQGAILLIDEVDRGSNKLLCLQAILEGKPYYNKNTGETIYPKKGFNIIATANSKGRGSEDGRYLSQILDDAFLERFAISFEQGFMPQVNEKKKLNNKLLKAKKPYKSFVTALVSWANHLRDSFIKGNSDEFVSSRRLDRIVDCFILFDNKMKAIEYGINRFENVSRMAFIDAYKMFDKDWDKNITDNMVEDVPPVEEKTKVLIDEELEGVPFG